MNDTVVAGFDTLDEPSIVRSALSAVTACNWRVTLVAAEMTSERGLIKAGLVCQVLKTDKQPMDCDAHVHFSVFCGILTMK